MTNTPKSLTIICLLAAFALNGCASHPPVAAPKEKADQVACIPAPAPAIPLAEPAAAAQPAPAAQVKESAPAAPAAAPADEKFRPLSSVYFGFDSSKLDQAAKGALDQFYQGAKGSKNPVTLEGFCDERGNDEYNMGLAEKRATAVRQYLTGLGLDAELLSTVPYGREYPAVPGHDEEAWKQNRRVEIVPKDAPRPGSKKRYGSE